MEEVRILQLGEQDLSKQYKLHDCVKWIHEPDLDKMPKRPLEIVLLDREITWEESEILFRLAKAYCLFLTESVPIREATQWLYRSKKGQVLSASRMKNFFVEEAPIYFAKPYGEKYQPTNIGIAQSFRGSVRWDGYNSVRLDGDYGAEFSQILFWRNTIPIQKDQAIDLWLEYKKDPGVEIMMQVILFRSGTVSDVQNYWLFSEEQMRDVVYIDNNGPGGPFFVSILAKGAGKLEIIALHDRYSRKNHGHFLPGGERVVADGREEIFFYFDPGDMKPPLNVYFSGYKTMEGFEGYNMMRNMGSPFVLVSESRLEGGAFYMGSPAYENALASQIRRYMEELHFTRDQVIFSGLSMGTFGALYYGCEIRPGTILLGKPLASIGDVAANEKINRPGTFPTSLDVLRKQYGKTDPSAVERMNRRFWKRFDRTQWSGTQFIVSYMIEDDYDSTAYQNLISHIRQENVTVYGKGHHGRHNDDTQSIVSWFIKQYHNILFEKFGREF